MEGTDTAPPKFSRYRSVRHKNSRSESQAVQTEPPPVPVPTQAEASVKRAPSRYRRTGSRANIQDATSMPTPALPPSPTKAAQKTLVLNYEDRAKKEHVRLPRQDGRSGVRERSHTAGQAHATTPRQGRSNHSKSDPSTTRSPTADRSYEAAREEARMILEGEFDRMQKLKQAQGSEAPTMRRRRNTHKEERPVPKKQEPMPSNQPEQASPPPPPLPQPQPIEEEPKAQLSPTRKFRQFIIGGAGNGPPQRHFQEPKGPEVILLPQVDAPQLHTTNVSRTPEVVAIPQVDAPQLHRTNVSKPSEAYSLPQVDAPQLHKLATTKPPEPARGYDAPVSAVNAGDRRVSIRCNTATITLPVTPTTTAKDLLNSASVVMSEPIDPKTAILLESFSQLGLERPLRRYERIRDVLNSWDTDSQNSLFILHASSCAAVGLELKDAPAFRPQNVILQMYHSSRPGHWNKKYLKLREDGQVSISDKENHLESTNICHLSDFDLYTPTKEQRKKIKSPKKICIAVKSQQKSAMFLNGENFAHFFCSGHKGINDRWYQAVWNWRSWYLVDVLGEGRKAPVPTHKKQFSLDSGPRPSTGGSTGTVPYQLGSFKPLLDIGGLRLSADDDAKGNDHRPMSRKGSVDIRRRPSVDIKSTSPKRTGTRSGAPPSSFPRRLVVDAPHTEAVEHDEDQAFTGTGLLARHASTKSQGGRGTGRGVQGKCGQPLVDLKEQSEFADGSLLRQLEAWKVANGEGEVKIDREKRQEGNVKVGEGY